MGDTGTLDVMLWGHRKNKRKPTSNRQVINYGDEKSVGFSQEPGEHVQKKRIVIPENDVHHNVPEVPYIPLPDDPMDIDQNRRGMVITSGHSSGQHHIVAKTKGKKRRRGVSKIKKIEKKLRKVGKLLPTVSRYHWQAVRPFSMATVSCNAAVAGMVDDQRKVLFQLDTAYNSSTIETKLNTMLTDDQNNVASGSVNTSYKVKRLMTITIKNGGHAKAHLKIVPYKVKCRTANSVRNEINVAMGERGYATWTENPGLSHVATPGSERSKVFPFLYSANNNWASETLGFVNKTNSYETKGKITEVILNPGDEIVIKSSNNLTYKPEEVDQDSHNFMPNVDNGVLVQVHGEIMHDVTKTALVGISDFHLDCFMKEDMMAQQANGLGLKQFDNDTFDCITAPNGWVAVKEGLEVEADAA